MKTQLLIIAEVDTAATFNKIVSEFENTCTRVEIDDSTDESYCSHIKITIENNDYKNVIKQYSYVNFTIQDVTIIK